MQEPNWHSDQLLQLPPRFLQELLEVSLEDGPEGQGSKRIRILLD
jgi:hypothetical protein